MTQEFHISITPVHNNEYLVRTEQVAPGVPLAEEQLVWPVDDWLTQVRHLMNDPLVDLLQGQGNGTETSPNECVNSFMELGQQLYQHLFQGILRDSWTTARGIAQHRGEMLRLRLGLKGSKLAQLPWEVMHGHTRDGLGLTAHPLATGVDLLFSRYQPARHVARSGGAIASPKSSVIRILMVVALPVDQDKLDLDQEARHLQQELRLQPDHLQENLVGTLPDIQVTILQHPSRAELTHALERSQYQVLHYAGHSDLGSDGGKLYLVDSKGLTETLTGDDLAGLLANNDIQLAVFNSCRSGHTAVGQDASQTSQRTLTDALVSRGVPGVLAMAERIPDDVALTLTRLFYRNLKQGYPIDLSLSRARQGLLVSYGSNQLYWALPTLYLHPDFDGYLTGGDRLLDNPADALIRVPNLYTPSLVDMDLVSMAADARVPSTSGTSTSPVPRPMEGIPSAQTHETSPQPLDSIVDATMDPLFDSAFQDAPTETMDFSERPDFQADLNSFDDDLGDDLEDDSSLIADETAELVHDLTSSDLT
ncbi:MAG: CHAT domain-containing protein, partial [Symploca sp. SIO2B6]|nr:CHAT domain-containing protein [Symploca sp. SIO2B6]